MTDSRFCRRGREKSLAPAKILTPKHPARSLDSIPYKLTWLLTYICIGVCVFMENGSSFRTELNSPVKYYISLCSRNST